MTIDFTNAEVTSAITDRYAGLSIKVPATERGDEPAFEITGIKVEVDTLEDGTRWVTAEATGYKLTKAGARSKASGLSTMFRVRQEEARHEIIRAATLATLARHGIDGPVENVDLRPWAEVKAADDEWLRQRYGAITE